MKKLVLLAFLGLSISLYSSAQELMWEQTNGPSGGYLHLLSTGPDGLIFGSLTDYRPESSISTIYRSTDHGNNWEATSLKGEPAYVIGVNNAGHAFATVDSTHLKSVDNGATWQEISLPSGIYDMVQGNADTLFGYGQGLFMSVDNGQSWTERDTATYYSLERNSRGELLKVSPTVLQISRDQGETWSDLLNTNSHIYSFTIGRNDTIFLLNDRGFFRVSPDGTSMEAVADGYFSFELVEASPTTGTIYSIAWLQSLIASRDNGRSWQLVQLLGFFPNEMLIDSMGIVYTVSWEGVARSDDDGISWVNAHEGIYQADVNSIISDNDMNIYATSPNRIYRTTDQGESWDEIFVEPNFNLIKDLTVSGDGDLYFISEVQNVDKSTIDSCSYNQCSYLCRSKDKGEKWDTIFNSMYINDVGIMLNGDIYITTYFGLRRSTDDGESWEPISEEFGGDILIDEARGLIYVRTVDQLHRTDDFGVTWTTYDHPGYSQLEMQINSRGDLIVATTDYAVEGQPVRYQISTDQGATMTDMDPLGMGVQGWLYVGNFDHLFFFSNSEIYRSMDHGETWNNIGSTPRLSAVTQLDNGQFYAAVYQKSVWRSTSLVPVSNVSPIANELHLYPNPARDNILIEYPGVKATDMLKLYDTKGQMFKEIPMKQPSITLNISDMKKGIYLLKIGEESRKVVVY